MSIDARTKAVNRTPASLSMPVRGSKAVRPNPRLAEDSVPHSSTVVARDNHGTDTKLISHSRMGDEIATPVKAFLSSNVTPRSGSRKARVDSASSTPNSTPNGTASTWRPASDINASEKRFDRTPTCGIKVPGGSSVGKADTAQNHVSEDEEAVSCLSQEVPSQQAPQNLKPTNPENMPMFFRASDLMSPATSSFTAQHFPSAVRRPALASIISDDRSATITERHSDTTSPLEQSVPRFFYANGSPEAEDTPKKPGSRTTSIVSTRRSAKQTPQPGQSCSHQERSASPLKDFELSRRASTSKASPRAHIHLAHNGIVQTEVTHFETPSLHQLDIRRRSSLKAGLMSQPRHSKASSVSSMDSRTNRRSSIAFSDVQKIQSSSSMAQAVSTPRYSSEKSANILCSPPPSSLAATPSPATQSPKNLAREPQSPIRVAPADSKIEQLNNLAANARRERKVLDLEISNSSLLAINRILEREMRKQTAELRRYRRLTSAGRISIAPSSRRASNRLSSFPGTEGSSDSDEDALDEDGDFNGVSDEDSSSIATSFVSLGSSAARKAQQRHQDEKVAQLDLSRQQELLLDSQRLNQSLKRCLGWTDDLIKEGKKALAYSVNAQEGDVRGRVLTSDEVGVEIMNGTGLLSPSPERLVNPWGATDQGPATDVCNDFHRQIVY